MVVRYRWLMSLVVVVAGITDEGRGVLLWVLSPRLEVHLTKGSILNFGGLPLVCYTNDVSVNSFCLWHLGRRRT